VKLVAVVLCHKCQQPIVSGENFGSVCFRIPNKEGYHFFRRRFAAGTAGKAT
jgi:hypothetical protein